MPESLFRQAASTKSSADFGLPVNAHLDELIHASIVLAEDLDNLTPGSRERLAGCQSSEELIESLTALGLLTEYQAGRIQAGTLFGLVLGQYRVLDRLGAGGMAVVFRAEHVRMRKQVAIKVMPANLDQDPRLLRRFMTEIRAIAQLQHPNIVGAIDAGEVPDGQGGALHFFVMEYVPGQDLEAYVQSRGPLAPSEACDLGHQVASALAEANKHGLVHRDIKPSNIQITPEGQAKLLDFGLARKLATGITEQGILLGTPDYVAPEQVRDPSSVDIRADLYGLGGVLYWCLTGSAPFPSDGAFLAELSNRLLQEPPRLRSARPEMPADLELVILKLMALHPDDRYRTPEAVMQALLPFLKSALPEHISLSFPRDAAEPTADAHHQALETTHDARRGYRVLVADDEVSIRGYCRMLLQAEGMTCDEAESGEEALAKALASSFDLLILDVNMGELSGSDVCRQVRHKLPDSHLKIIMASGNANIDIMAQMLLHGADDFITKPFSGALLQARVKALLRLKDAQDRAQSLQLQVRALNNELDRVVTASDGVLTEARDALVFALGKLVAERTKVTGAYLKRLQKYVRLLGEEAAGHPHFAGQIDATFVELAACCAALHDIGKVGLPDHILMKPGKLEGDERLIMQAHTTIGADTLNEVARTHASALPFLSMAIDIARHHHERFDGTGYPDGLAGSDIPLAARLVAICDVYDALRSRRVYRPALSHHAALQVMSGLGGSHFDPGLLQIFLRSAQRFEKIFRDYPD